MAPRVTCIFGLHNHQPVGNSPEVIAEANRLAYHPFLRALERHPGIKTTFHITGPLLEWMILHAAEDLEILRAMAAAGQVEILTGGYYEPILPIIPETDRVGQIAKLTAALYDIFGVAARGAWLAERVWEPQLPASLHGAGVEYTILDEQHFHAAGLRESETFGYFITEEQGDTVAVFPINQRLRYAIPFSDPEETIEWLRALAGRDDHPVVTMIDDGEKFGVWPGTYDLCHRRGWLERFFAALEAESDWLTLATPGEILDTRPPLGRVYLPTASYSEMMQWSLPPDAIRSQQQAPADRSSESAPMRQQGFWRSFLRKYSESNHLHKKMLDTSRKVNALPRSALQQHALDALWQGQCNCAYWHGLFGGLYLSNLRHALYQNLILADLLADSLVRGTGEWIHLREFDFDADGRIDCVVETPRLSAIINPSLGGSIAELDDRARCFNLVNTLMRRDEAYHDKIRGFSAASADSEERQDMENFALADAKAKGLDQSLRTDWYRRSFLIDHFLEPATTLDQFASGHFPEQGDFVNQPYHLVAEKRGAESIRLRLERQGGVYPEGVPQPVTVSKSLTFDAPRSGFRCEWLITNHSSSRFATRFGCEFNINLLGGDVLDRFIFATGRHLADARPVSHGETEEVEEFGAADRTQDFQATFRLDKPARLWRAPIETVSLSAEGYEMVYQGSCLMPLWDLTLEPQEAWSVALEFDITPVSEG